MTRDEYLRQLEEDIADDKLDDDAATALLLKANEYPKQE